MRARKPIPATTKNLIFRYFRLYIPLSHVSRFDWAGDRSSRYDLSVYVAAPEPVKERKLKTRILAHLRPKVEEKSVVQEQLTSLGFSETPDKSNLTCRWQGHLQRRSTFTLSAELLSHPAAKLKKENGYPQLITLEDYLIKVHGLLLKDTEIRCYQKIAAIFAETLTPREK